MNDPNAMLIRLARDSIRDHDIPHAIIASLRPAVASPLPLVPTIEGYEIHNISDQGGQGYVCQGKHLATGRRVAIKLLRSGIAAHSTQLCRFEKEIELIATLQHPFIVPVLDCGVSSGYPYYVMPYVDGMSLLAYAQQDHVCAERILSLFCLVCEAISFAHDKGIVHLDLKPNNILIDALGKPHLLDFGLAHETIGGRFVDARPRFEGTPAYAAPEQLSVSPRSIGPPTDVFAIGTMLYECLTGQLPRRGSTLDSKSPVPPSLLRSNLRRNVDEVVLKALEFSPYDRYQSTRSLADDIQLLVTQVSDVPLRVSQNNPMRRRRLTTIVVAMASLLQLPISDTHVQERSDDLAGNQRENIPYKAKHSDAQSHDGMIFHTNEFNRLPPDHDLDF